MGKRNMKKRIQKIAIMILVVVSTCFCGLVGCKDKYADMSIELDKESIELFLDEYDNDNNLVGNTAKFVATVSAGDGISKEVYYELSTPDVISISKSAVGDMGDTTFEITANEISTNPVIVTIWTKEGSKSASLEVTVTRKVTGVKASSAYKPFVVVGEEGTNLDTTQAVIFTPENTSQKGVTYSILNSNGNEATITPNGHLVVTKKNTSEPIIVKIQSENETLEAIEVPVKVIEPITDEDFSLLLNGEELPEEYTWAVLDFGEGNSVLNLNLELNTLEDVILNAETGVIQSPDSQSVFTLNTTLNETLSQNTQVQLRTNGNTGTNTLKLVLQVNGYDYKVEKTYKIKVAKLPTTIQVNGEEISNQEKQYDIYDKYQNNLGQRFEISVGDELAYDRNYIIRLSSKYDDLSDSEKQQLLSYIKISYLSGEEVDITQTISSSTKAVYIKALTTNKVVSLDIVPAGSQGYNNLFGTITLNLSQGVDAQSFHFGSPANEISNEKDYNMEVVSSNLASSIGFYVPSDQYSSKFTISSSNEELLSIVNPEILYRDGYLNGENMAFVIDMVAKREGYVTLTVTTDNNVEISLNIRLFKNIDEFTITTESPIQNPDIADNGEDMYEQVDFANEKTLSKLVIKYGTRNLRIDIVKFIENQDKTFVTTNALVKSQTLEVTSGSDVIYAVMQNDEPYGYISSLSVGNAKVKITLSVYTLDGTEKTISKEFDVQVYIPVDTINISKAFIELYDTSQMMYFEEKLESELFATISPRNATLTYKTKDNTIKDFSVIRWSQNNNGASIVENENSNSVIKVVGQPIIGDSNSKTVIITATITQFSRVYSTSCEVVVRRPIKVSEITNMYLETVNSNDKSLITGTMINDKLVDIYLDSRNGIENNSHKLSADILPSFPTFADMMYIPLPSYLDYSSRLYLAQPNLILKGDTFKVNRAGTSKILAVAKDSISSADYQNDLFTELLTNVYANSSTTEQNLTERINEFFATDSEIKYRLLEVKVADGSSEALALHVNNLSDLLKINSKEGLQKYYVLTDIIDCSSIANFAPLGIVNGENLGFSGNFNGNSSNGYYLKNVKFNYNQSSNQEYNYGLFSLINEDAVVKNLKLEVKELNISVINANTSNMYIGGIAVMNNGTIDSCETIIKSSNVRSNTINMYVGAVTAFNSSTGKVLSSKASGNLNITRKGGEKTAIGGLVGENQNLVQGNFNMFDSTDKLSQILTNQDYDSSVAILFKSEEQLKLVGFSVGGIVGLNTKTVQNVSSNASIGLLEEVTSVTYMPSNVGGIVGYNFGEENSLAVINEALSVAKLYGNQNIGGIAGFASYSNISNVYTLMFESYDILDTSHILDYFMISGHNNVGAIVGSMSYTSVSYAMARSYVSRIVDNTAFAGDIRLYSVENDTGTNSRYIGGIAGIASNSTIEKSFAHLSIFAEQNGTVGGLVGKMDSSTLQNVYVRGSINANAKLDAFVGELNTVTATNLYSEIKSNQGYAQTTLTGTNQLMIDDVDSVDFTAWLISSGNDNWLQSVLYNNNLPVISIKGNPFILQEPQTLKLAFNDATEFVNQNGTLNGNHQTMQDSKKALMLCYQAEELNHVKLADLFNLTVEPASANKAVRYNYNSDIVRIANGELVILSTGTVTITCVSLLNNQAFDSVTIFVADALTQFDLYEDAGLSSVISTLTMLKNSSSQIYFASNSISEIKLEVLMSGQNNIASFNGTMLTDSSVILTSSIQNMLIQAVDTGSVEITFKPYFEVEGEKIYLPLSKTITINIVNGIKDVTLEFDELSVSQKDTTSLSVSVDSEEETNVKLQTSVLKILDNSDNILSNLTATLSQNENTKIYTAIITEKNKSQVLDELTFKIDLENISVNNFKLKFDILKAPETCKVVFDINIKAYIGEDENVTTIGHTLAKDFMLTIMPQPVHFIGLDFYSNAELSADGSYNVNEVPQDTILAGRQGLIKIDLYPEFANIDRVELTYANFDYSVDIRQLVKKQDSTNGYVLLSMSTPKIVNGIVFDKTYKNIYSQEDSNGDLSFNGYLYAYVLIPSNARGSIDFVVTVYSSNGEVVTKRLPLQIDLPSEVEVTFDGLSQAFVAQGVTYESNLVVTTTKLMDSIGDDSNLTISFRNGSNGGFENLVLNTETNGVLLTKVSTTLVQDSIYQTKYALRTSANLGSTLEFRATYKKLVNNQVQSYASKNTLELYVSMFTVDGFELSGAVDNVFERTTGSTYNLKVKLITTPTKPESKPQDASSSEYMLYEQIENLETVISQKLNTWYALRLNQDKSLEYLPLNLDYPYEYFRFSQEEGEFIKISPTRESLTEVLQTLVAVEYVDGMASASSDYNSASSELVSLITHSHSEQDFANKKVYYKKSTLLKFIYNNTSDKPNPIATLEQFKNMQNGKNYRLINNIDIDEPFTPLTVQIAGLDGNGFEINLNQGFDISSQLEEDTINLGLFASVDGYQTVAGTMDIVLKNIKLNVNTSASFDYTSYNEQPVEATTINLGFLAGVNNGTIYNCQVNTFEVKPDGTKDFDSTASVNIKTNITNTNGEQVLAYIGGLVGQNEKSITHSRSYAVLNANRGFVAGLVSQNQASIASSFYKAKTSDASYDAIKNDATTEVNNLTAGLVAINDTDGTIKMSYVEGGDSQTSRMTNGSVNSNSLSAGFVNQNSGLIENSYSNINVVSQKRSSGFAFSNQGTIQNCYSASMLTQNNSAHTAFMGTTVTGRLNSTNNNILNCYYLKGDAIMTASGELATEFESASDLINFNFSDDGLENGIWNTQKTTFDGTERVNPNYEITVNGFGYTVISVTSKDTLLPTLVDANIIAIPHNAISEIQNQDDPTKDDEYIWQDTYLGSMFDPIVITSPSDYNSILKEVNTGSNIDNLNRYIRIVNNLTFSTKVKPQTTNKDFSGYICGNGFTISGLTISANQDESAYSTGVKQGNNDYGLFATISGLDHSKAMATDSIYASSNNSNRVTLSQLATVKNLNIKVGYLSANQVKVVGTLAGTMIDAKISNIEIDGQEADVVVQGKNFVGGLAGQILGESKVKFITTNISANAGNVQQVGNAEKYALYSSSVAQNIKQYEQEKLDYGYAGSVAGIVNLSASGTIQNVTVASGVYIVANHGGLAFGLVGKDSTVNHISAKVDGSQYIRATATAGALVAENRGTIVSSSVSYSSGTTSNNLFGGTPRIIGGLVGFNYGGTIIGSYSQIDVINSLSGISGGLVGTTVGGDISYSYATGDVSSQHVAGGLIGNYLKETNLVKLTSEQTEIEDDSRIYTIDKFVINQDAQIVSNRLVLTNNTDVTPTLKLANTISLRTFGLKTEKFGAVIGTSTENGIADEFDTDDDGNKIYTNYYIYTKLSDGTVISAFGNVSDVPNGSEGSTPAEKPVCFTNQSSGNLTIRDITSCSYRYKQIFKNGDWSKYFKVDDLSSNSPYLLIVD